MRSRTQAIGAATTAALCGGPGFPAGKVAELSVPILHPDPIGGPLGCAKQLL